MNKYPYHDFTVTQLLDYGIDKTMMSKHFFVNLMTQHRPKGICNVDNTNSSNSGMSSKLPNATANEFLGHQY
jgi:hypothetical protein